MSDIAIRVENLSKQYRIGGKVKGYKTVRESITDGIKAPFNRPRAPKAGGADVSNTFWALRDISFDVNRGEVVGVIGRNGAGKSTLLKILSRITEPTGGAAQIHGRIGSLLEVGTGFHPELTGRENIFLNGAILGMRRAEIERQFDAIVSFAEVEKFIDTPVKRYSSGMYLRLAFAVAAHLETEILLVDEVLAVGDVAFQKKCMGKMGDVASQGRTVLLVSHNMGAIRSLCQKAVLLDHSEVASYGDVATAIELYYDAIGVMGRGTGDDTNTRSVFGRIQINDGSSNTVEQSQGFQATVRMRIAEPLPGFSIYCVLKDMHGQQIFHLREESGDINITNVSPGVYNLSVQVPPLWLTPGLYALSFKTFLQNMGQARHESDHFPLDIVGTSSVSQAIIHPGAQWAWRPVDEEAASR